MKLYGKKFLRKSIQRQVINRIETMEGVLWDIIPAQRVCRIRQQGSDELIVCYYPIGWGQPPAWLKPGMPIRVNHVGGHSARFEVVGIGQTIPTPQTGSPTPTLSDPPDAVMTGCSVSQMPNVPGMKVMIMTGTYRIADTIYNLDEIAMSASSVYTMGEGGTMSEIAGVVAIDAAPAAGSFRYDLIVVGTDGIIDVVKGSNFTTTESVPSCPADHVELDRILIAGGMTEIKQNSIGQSFVTPEPTYLVVTPSSSSIAWMGGPITINVAVLDQYNNAILSAGYGWYLTLEFLDGNGTLYSDEDGGSLTKVGQHTGSTNNDYDFDYARDNLDPGDESPTFRATLEINYTITADTQVILEDAGGNPMY